MNDTVTLHMLGDPVKAAEALVKAREDFANANRKKKLVESISAAFRVNSDSTLHDFQGSSLLGEEEKIYLDARLNEGINYFEVREEASRIFQKMNPRFPELIYITKNINGRVVNILAKMILEPEAIDIQEYGGFKDFFNAIESYLISGMKARGYRSVKRTVPLPGTLIFSKRLSKNKDENL